MPPLPRIPGAALSADPLARAYHEPVRAERTMQVATLSKRRHWTRRLHAVLGLISAFNLILLISTGFLLQHRDWLRLDEHSVSRRILPRFYRLDDPGRGVRADIVVADLHSGRLLGTAGALLLDTVTLLWLVLLATGLVMYVSGARNGGGSSSRQRRGRGRK